MGKVAILGGCCDCTPCEGGGTIDFRLVLLCGGGYSSPTASITVRGPIPEDDVLCSGSPAGVYDADIPGTVYDLHCDDLEFPEVYAVDVAIPGECNATFRVNSSIICEGAHGSARLCFGSKTITITPIGGDLTEWGFAWGRHSTIAAGLSDDATRTVEVHESSGSVLLSSDCGLTWVPTTIQYPEAGAAPFIEGPIHEDFFVECPQVQPEWCCEDASLTLFALHKDGDASWAGLAPTVDATDFFWLCDDLIITGEARLSRFPCDCTYSGPENVFLPKQVDLNVDASILLGSLGPPAGLVGIAVSGGGAAPFYGNVNTYITDFFGVTSDEIILGGGLRIVAHSARVLAVLDGTNALVRFATQMRFEVVDDPSASYPAGMVYCPFPPFIPCVLPYADFFVKAAGGIGDPCDFHVDAECTVDTPYGFPVLYSQYTASGPS
jgi:hypothetical protein